MDLIIPIMGILAGIIIPIAVFIWLYFEEKGKRETALEIAKHLQDPIKVEELMNIFEERKGAGRLQTRRSNYAFCWDRHIPPGCQ